MWDLTPMIHECLYRPLTLRRLSFQYKENLTNWITEMKLAAGAQKSEHMNRCDFISPL